jgi:hypothetical protein
MIEGVSYTAPAPTHVITVNCRFSLITTSVSVRVVFGVRVFVVFFLLLKLFFTSCPPSTTSHVGWFTWVGSAQHGRINSKCDVIIIEWF